MVGKGLCSLLRIGSPCFPPGLRLLLLSSRCCTAKFFWFFFFLFLNLAAFTYFGIMAINLTPAVQFGTVFVAFFFTLWNFLCGFLMAQPNIPGQWIWLVRGQGITH